MLTLYDYLPSQNGYKVRLLLQQLRTDYRTIEVGLFAGQGKDAAFLARNPTGAVPVLELEDGRALAESNAILGYLAEGTRFLPGDAWQRAQVFRWMFFEEDYIQNGLASLRYWTMTGKLGRRPVELVAAKRATSAKSLAIMERWLTGRDFLTDAGYTIADISVFAYVWRLEEAGLRMSDYPAVAAWTARVSSQPDFLATVHPYSLDPHSAGELP